MCGQNRTTQNPVVKFPTVDHHVLCWSSWGLACFWPTSCRHTLQHHKTARRKPLNKDTALSRDKFQSFETHVISVWVKAEPMPGKLHSTQKPWKSVVKQVYRKRSCIHIVSTYGLHKLRKLSIPWIRISYLPAEQFSISNRPMKGFHVQHISAVSWFEYPSFQNSNIIP